MKLIHKKREKNGRSIYSQRSSHGTQSVRSLDDKQRCKFFVAIIHVHMIAKSSTRKLNYIGSLTEGCRLEL